MKTIAPPASTAPTSLVPAADHLIGSFLVVPRVTIASGDSFEALTQRFHAQADTMLQPRGGKVAALTTRTAAGANLLRSEQLAAALSAPGTVDDALDSILAFSDGQLGIIMLRPTCFCICREVAKPMLQAIDASSSGDGYVDVGWIGPRAKSHFGAGVSLSWSTFQAFTGRDGSMRLDRDAFERAVELPELAAHVKLAAVSSAVENASASA